MQIIRGRGNKRKSGICIIGGVVVQIMHAGD